MEDQIIIPGIGIGPMTDKYDIKILICYLLDSIKQPLSKDTLDQILRDDEYVNYFSFCEALKELLESKHISCINTDKGEIYSLNEFGLETSNKLSRSLPQSLRDRIVEAAIKITSKIKKERENEVKITQYGNGYKVSCTIHDSDFDLLNFDVFAPDMIQSEKIKEKFLQDPLNFYQNIISFLFN